MSDSPTLVTKPPIESSDCSQAWFKCTTHNRAHTGLHCDLGTRETCTDVGPFSTRSQATIGVLSRWRNKAYKPTEEFSKWKVVLFWLRQQEYGTPKIVDSYNEAIDEAEKLVRRGFGKRGRDEIRIQLVETTQWRLHSE